ncbi:MAG: VCBS repeat-containing protein [Candidatus Altiarchaeota archaeon]|nr:VCBS repeat-containing protein [Candidatus Altiarchaeota archaeon]
MPSNNLVKILAISIISLYLAQSPMAEQQLSLKWTYDVDSRIRVLTSGDLDNDSYPEIIAISTKKVYILNANGDLRKDYSIDFNPSAVFIADLDNDGLNEILIGSGWMNTSDTNEPSFDFGDIEDLKEREKIIYKIMRDLGDIYFLDTNDPNEKKPVKWLEVGEWVRDIFVDDLDEDGGNEIIIASGGTNINYITQIYTEIDNETGNLTYVRNRSEEYSENGSVWVFNTNGSLIYSYHTDNIVWCVHSSLLMEGEGKAIIAGSKEVLAIARNATELWTFKSLGENYSIKRILIDNIDNDKFNEVVAAFIGPVVSGIHVISNEGSEIWQYRFPSKNIYDLFHINIDIDSDKEIVIASKEGIHILTKDGQTKGVYALASDMDEIHITDLMDNEYLDFIISSGNQLSVYEINVSGSVIKLQKAEKYYREAEDYYVHSKYEDALASLNRSRLFYSEVGNLDGVSLCDSLIRDVTEALEKRKRGDASSSYNNAVNKHYLGEHEEAMTYAVQAMELYVKLGDQEGISKCNSLIEEIKGELNPEVTTTSTTFEKTTTTLTKEERMFDMSIILLLIIIVLLIIFGLHQISIQRSRKSQRSRKRKAE